MDEPKSSEIPLIHHLLDCKPEEIMKAKQLQRKMLKSEQFEGAQFIQDVLDHVKRSKSVKFITNFNDEQEKKTWDLYNLAEQRGLMFRIIPEGIAGHKFIISSDVQERSVYAHNYSMAFDVISSSDEGKINPKYLQPFMFGGDPFEQSAID